MTLGVRRVTDVIHPVDTHSLVIQGIVATLLGVVVMDKFLDKWSLVQSVEGSRDTSSVRSPILQLRRKSTPLQHASLPQVPRRTSLFQVSDLRPVASGSIG